MCYVSLKLIQIFSVLLLTEAAALCDLDSGRIPNGLIAAGLGMGAIYQCFASGVTGVLLYLGGVILPAVLFGPLYYFRMMGAGDIKLFCVLGGFLGPLECLMCIVRAVFAGGALSLTLMLQAGNLTERLFYFLDYINEYLETGHWQSYLAKTGEQARFCFSVPVFFSVLWYIGGVI